MTQHLLFSTLENAEYALEICNNIMKIVAIRNGYLVNEDGIIGKDSYGNNDPRGITKTVAEILVYPDGRHGFQSPISTYRLDSKTAENLTANFESLYGTDYEIIELEWSGGDDEQLY